MINLGCGARAASDWNNIDFSWLNRVGRHPWLCRWLHKIGLLSDARLERTKHLDPNTLIWNLKYGIPFDDQSADVVFHSHLFEHLDRPTGDAFLKECNRVLAPGGVIRIVVPDLEKLARDYLAIMDDPVSEIDIDAHTFATEEIFDQMVRRTPVIRGQQGWVNRVIESTLIGDTDRSGIMHCWMYDRHSLADALRRAGFNDVQVHTHLTSSIDDWQDFVLDNEPDGSAYKHSSLYMEARRPATATLDHTREAA